MELHIGNINQYLPADLRVSCHGQTYILESYHADLDEDESYWHIVGHNQDWDFFLYFVRNVLMSMKQEVMF